MSGENDKVLEAMQRRENRIWGGFKLIAVIIAVVALLILKFDDIEKALKLGEVAAASGQHCTCPVHTPPPAQPKEPRSSRPAPAKHKATPKSRADVVCDAMKQAKHR